LVFGEGFPLFRELLKFTFEEQLFSIGRETLTAGR
jgi:hypothetical protein